MESKEFDDILKNKLQSLSDSTGKPDWDRMSRALEEDSEKDQMFDEQVNRKLQQINIHNYARPNWNSLYELISQRIQNKNRVLASKAFEIVAIFLLLFTINNMGLFHDPYQSNESTKSPVKSEQLFASTELIVPDNIDLSSEEEINVERKSTVSPLLQSKNRIDISEIELNNKTALSTIHTNSKFEKPEELSGIQIDEVVDKQKNIQKQAHRYANQNVSDVASVELLESTKISVNLQNQIPIEVLEKAFPRDYPTLNLDRLAVKKLALNSVVPVLEGNSSKIKSKKWFFGGEIGQQFHTIESAVYRSLTSSRNPNSYMSKRKATSSEVAFLVGRKLKNTEISTGVAFQKLEYSPGISLTSGNLSTDFKETRVNSIEYDFITVPFDIHWNIFNRGAWNFQLNTGFLTNILVRAKERISQNIYIGTRTFVVQDENIDRSLLNFDFQQGVLDDNNDTPIFSENLGKYFNFKTKLGFSLNRKFNSNISVFGKFDYLYQLPFNSQFLPLSSNIDVIHSMSIKLGVKQYFG